MILIVEPDNIIAECIARACRPHQTRICQDPITALDILSEDELPTLLVIDVSLPAANGFALIHEIASYSELAEIPIVLIMDCDTEPPAELLLDYGVKGLIDPAAIHPAVIHDMADKYD